MIMVSFFGGIEFIWASPVFMLTRHAPEDHPILSDITVLCHQ
jgi:hypothetical protein